MANRTLTGPPGGRPRGDATRDADTALTWRDRVGDALADTIEHDPGATVTERPEVAAGSGQPGSPGQLGSPGRPSGHLAALAGRDPSAQLTLERTLGKGGMGVVWLARQESLARDVAVKTLRPERKSDDAVRSLLREAWVTGALEHPNVVPVHDLGVDAEGTPFIVFKRIEGVAWSQLIRDGRGVAERFGAEDLLEWNLGILLQVINAVRYAHSRGVLHRDLKPDNVMIGEFGEVYVVDWGLAVSLHDDRSGRLPLARDVRQMAGTPAYMAPEMLDVDAAALSERTDVYLLGAVLYEIIAGQPPHVGASVEAVLSSIAASQPALPDDAPADLARICRRALDPDPAARFERADHIRAAAQQYLKHRGAARLVERAHRRLGELHALLAVPAGDDPAWRRQLYAVFGACRFGFQEAVRAWPDSAAARDGLRDAVAAVAEYELSAGDPRAAANLLAELDQPPAALSERVDAALRDDQERMDRLHKLDADLDPAVGARTRSLMVALLGVVWTGAPLVLWLVHSREELFDYRVGIIGSASVLAALVALLVWARESVLKTAVNRRLFGAIALVPAVQLAFTSCCWLLGVPPPTAFVLVIFLWWLMATFVTVLGLSFIWPIPVAYFAAFVIAAWRPELSFVVAAGANSILLPVAWLNWRRYRHLYDDAASAGST